MSSLRAVDDLALVGRDELQTSSGDDAELGGHAAALVVDDAVEPGGHADERNLPLAGLEDDSFLVQLDGVLANMEPGGHAAALVVDDATEPGGELNSCTPWRRS